MQTMLALALVAATGTSGDFLLSTTSQASIAEGGEVVGCECEEIGAHHPTFFATHSASSPGVIAPTCAPMRTSWRATASS